MNQNNSTNAEFKPFKSQILETMNLIIAYTPFLNIAMGTTGNPATFFLILSDKSLHKMSSMVILMHISFVDTLFLFNWNMNKYVMYKSSSRFI